jgi:hypothetical protein
MERFNHLDWPIQKERILAFARKYRGRLILDATGIGDPIFDDLKHVYVDIEGFKLTSASKTSLIQRLIVAVEQRKVMWPSFASTVQEPRVMDGVCADWQVLTNEMKRYEYEILPSGTITYNAPAGYHDDCVMALALANHRRWETESVGNMLRVEGGKRQAVGGRRRERVLVG